MKINLEELKILIREAVRSEIHTILNETWSSTGVGVNTGKASYGVESTTPRGWDRDPVPPQRHRMHDKPWDPMARNPDINYDQKLAPWKQELLQMAIVQVRKCVGSEQQVAHVQKMLNFVLANYEDDEQPNLEYGKELVMTIVNRFCDK